MMNYTITYNGATALSKGLIIETRPSIPSAIADITEFEVLSRDGLLHRDEGTVQDVEISIDFALVNVPETQWMTRFRAVTAWLFDDVDKRLFLSDDPNWFYEVVKVEIGSNVSRDHRMGGRFTAVFTCRGYAYLTSGRVATNSYTNYYDTCKPLYILSGEGNATLSVNGKTMLVNVGQGVTIDTDLMICYRTASGVMQNTAVTGDYADLWLVPGANDVSISGGPTMQVIPRWRRRL